ncbi:hypothetical protein [Glaciimonas soli]|uniref:Lipoprotein n=1 Tax=Glaciimonas soli TaxID=2590999 RepID=A0A843YWQ5_9BURK|nr:hypothetical protein [Glaciimonas soli]MQR01731.1 hypothetical protein [Glaciimonas soli]
MAVRDHCYRLFAVGLMAVVLTACNSIGGFAGAAAGVATGAVSANPAVGYAVGIGVQAGTDAATKYLFRNMQQAEQDALASVIGQLQEGETSSWQNDSRLSFSRGRGKVTVTRVVQSSLTVCKEAIFSLDDTDKMKREWFTVSACQQGEKWKWAVAEPAVDRWGSLQ